MAEAVRHEGSGRYVSAVPSVSPQRIESVDNALRLILLLRDRDRIGVTEAARELGVAPSTAHRLLGALGQRDFAVRDERKGYRAGPVLLDGSPRRAWDERVRVLVRPHLEHVAARVGETIHLVVRSGQHVTFIDGVESRQALRVGLRVGRVLPAHCTSGGTALLATLSNAELSDTYPSGLPEWAHQAMRDLAGLRRRLATVRSLGYAVNHGESEPGITAVGVCLRDAGDRPLAAMTVAVPDVRAGKESVEMLANELRSSAATMTSLL